MIRNRIKKDMDLQTMISEMAEGNLGALICLNMMLKSNPLTLFDIYVLDSKKIYGYDIYKLWNDCSGGNIKKLNETIKFIAHVSEETIHKNLEKEHPDPFI